jgi:pimeloyl-ACP methyl ester carboxylesterase
VETELLDVAGTRLEVARKAVSTPGLPTAVRLHEGLGCVARAPCEVALLPSCRHSPHRDQPEQTEALIARCFVPCSDTGGEVLDG